MDSMITDSQNPEMVGYNYYPLIRISSCPWPIMIAAGPLGLGTIGDIS